MRTTKGPTRPDNRGDQESDPETQVDLEHGDEQGDEEGDEDGAEPKRTAKIKKTVKAGDTVTLRRAGPCRAVLHDPAKVKKIDGDEVATLEILGGRSAKQVLQGIKRYNLENGMAPTDQVLPSWIADDWEVG